MAPPVDDLLSLLELEPTAPGRFRDPGHASERVRLYGGQLLAQALLAAGRSVAGNRSAHSLHAYFLRGGDATLPVEYSVASIRESGSFTTCRVTSRQAGRTLLDLTASFHVAEPGPEHDLERAASQGPDDAVPIDDWMVAQPDLRSHDGLPYFVDAIEFRQAPATFRPAHGVEHGEVHEPVRDVWLRSRAPLPDDPIVHQCVLAYASDKPLLGTTVLAAPLHGDTSAHLVASLDHSMWFHRDFRVDEWLRLRVESATTSRGRAFARGEFVGGDGVLAASAIQEGLVRPLRPS